MPQLPPPTPEEIATFKLLFEAHYAEVRNFIYYKCGDIAEAEDMAQEAFAIAWTKRDGLRQNQAKNYLFTIANNLFINVAKHRQVVLRFETETQARPTPYVSDPQFEMEYKAFEAQLFTAIEALPEKQRVVFLMNRIDKRTYQDIADSLSLSVKAVEKRMHQALQALRKISPKI